MISSIFNTKDKKHGYVELILGEHISNTGGDVVFRIKGSFLSNDNRRYTKRMAYVNGTIWTIPKGWTISCQYGRTVRLMYPNHQKIKDGQSVTSSCRLSDIGKFTKMSGFGHIAHPVEFIVDDNDKMYEWVSREMSKRKGVKLPQVQLPENNVEHNLTPIVEIKNKSEPTTKERTSDLWMDEMKELEALLLNRSESLSNMGFDVSFNVKLTKGDEEEMLDISVKGI